MTETSVFVTGEEEGPAVIDDALLDEKLNAEDFPPTFTLRDLIDDHLGAGVSTFDVYSPYSMLRAIHALQQITKMRGSVEGGTIYDAVKFADQALREIAISGDFEEHVEFDGDDTGEFTLEDVKLTEQGAVTWGENGS